VSYEGHRGHLLPALAVFDRTTGLGLIAYYGQDFGVVFRCVYVPIYCRSHVTEGICYLCLASGRSNLRKTVFHEQLQPNLRSEGNYPVSKLSDVCPCPYEFKEWIIKNTVSALSWSLFCLTCENEKQSNDMNITYINTVFSHLLLTRLKPSGNYTYHLLCQSIILHFVHRE
jgi:hypothetical protein